MTKHIWKSSDSSSYTNYCGVTRCYLPTWLNATFYYVIIVILWECLVLLTLQNSFLPSGLITSLMGLTFLSPFFGCFLHTQLNSQFDTCLLVKVQKRRIFPLLFFHSFSHIVIHFVCHCWRLHLPQTIKQLYIFILKWHNSMTDFSQ